MAWTTPYSAALNDAFPASVWNASVRDNFAETEAAKATLLGKGGHFITAGANSLVARFTRSDHMETGQNTSATSYADLGTIGPQVSVTTGAAVMVFMSCEMSNTVANAQQKVGFAVSGATTAAPSDDGAFWADGNAAGCAVRRGLVVRALGLTPGVNTFTMKYVVSSGIGTFSNREIIVMPF